MKINDIIKERKGFLNSIKGKWESETFEDSESNRKCKVTFTIDDNFGVSNEPVCVTANKTYLNNNAIQEISIAFWWINTFLISNYVDFNGGVVAKDNTKNEIGLYNSLYFSNFELTDENLILKFRKI